MKTFKTALAVITAALLAMTLLASPASAVLGVDDKSNSGTLNQQQPGVTPATNAVPPYEEGEHLTLQANFANSTSFNVTFYRKNGTSWDPIGTAATNANGNAYIDYTVVAGSQTLWAEGANDKETEQDTFTGSAPPGPPSTTATLDEPTNGGKTWTAHFDTPKSPGAATKLQIQRIYTHEVSDVDAVNPTASRTRRMGPWTTIATSTQDENGDSTFNLSSPYPYRVPHKYRAVSGDAKSCDPVDARDTNPPLCQEFGLPLTDPKNTGLSAVYFNTNEGHAVDTRTRYFEGEFRMTADSKGLGCSNIGVDTNGNADNTQIKQSVMKGRGNYSWSFKRKSYTLKLQDAADLCGMGSSKKYALVSQDYDKSFLRNALAQFVGKNFDNMEWTPDSKPVDLYLNGKYLGNYLLVERIAIEDLRVNIDELNGDDPEEQVDPGRTGGYILEWDFRKGADYNVSLGSDSGWVGVKEPENDLDREGENTGEGISSAHKSYINSYLNSADNALRRDSCQSSDYLDFIDRDSAVDYYIAMEYMKPVDGNMWASVYMYKPRSEKLHFGPLWDFDLAAGSATRAGNVASSSGFYLKNNLGISAQQSSNTWFNCLNKRSSFRNAVAARWDEVQGSMNVGGFIDDQKSIIKSSAETSFSNAPNGASHSYRISDYQVIKSNFDADVSYLRSWATGRKSWLNSSSGF
jgi:hypothetical protein